jgi:dTDP-4-dehydrorhamnose 3,5-epimerase
MVRLSGRGTGRSMKLRSVHDAGWALFESALWSDERGWLTEALRIDVLQAHAGPVAIAQENLTRSRRGVLRGLHYQFGSPQGKLVRVVEGRIHDVIVDLRRGSPYFGRSFGIGLDANDPASLWVPPGFAHGFLALEHSLVLYALTHPWDERLDRAIRWNSPGLSIDWPLGGQAPLLSAKDLAAPDFAQAEVFENAAGAGPPWSGGNG